ncbi:MAG TPA: tetratricopeptide repeat protein, partial [Casimicrobiaceae bacterium]|nr:tetratricopeptide repeat protein [Casimicrobiaceae bacterium]
LQMLSGDLAGARPAFERALSLYRTANADSAALGVLVNLGDLTWALGDLDTALQQCREAVRLMRGAPLFAKEMLGTCLTNLAGVLIERGDLDEALRVAREGLPLRQDSGHAWVAMDHFALRAALVGKLENAARIAGHVDATHRAKPSLRQPNEARAYARLMELLRARLDEDRITRLLAEGAEIGGDEACRLALEN